jgi:gluconate 2-dehydrogenase alpha chain
MRKLPPVDVVLVGFGWTGAIMAQELTDAGLQVLAIERGAWRDTPTHFPPTTAPDELRWYWRKEMFQGNARDTLTFRNTRDQVARPMRRWGSFLPGEGVGGGGVHWNGQTWRFLPSDFVAASHNTARYGALADGMTVQDYGVTYDELEPHYDRFDKLCGIGGKAGNLRGEIVEGGNPFEGPRSAEYPNPPMHMTFSQNQFIHAARQLGLHPFPGPSANLTRPYVNPLGAQLAPCSYCGFCEKYGCGNYSKASAQTTILPVLMRKPNFTLKVQNEVLSITRDNTGRRATGVIHVDVDGNRYEQPADLVILCAYPLSNARLMMLSGIGETYNPATGEGLVGKNYCYQVMAAAQVFFDGKFTNEFAGAGALGAAVDDYNGDNFDHGGMGFIGGGYIANWTTNARPIETHRTPEGTPTWGSQWKAAVADNFLSSTTVGAHGASMAHATNALDLDPTYKDAYGQPLLRMTYDFTPNDRAMARFLSARATDIARLMGGREIKVVLRDGPYDSMPYQTTHNTGGTIMGTTPANSVVNRYLQSWDVPNLFVMGAGVFPQNAGYNPTGTVAALTYWAAEAIRTRYLRNPGPLVQA